MTDKRSLKGIINLKRVAATAGVLALTLLPVLSLAQSLPTPPTGTDSPIRDVSGVYGVLNGVLRFMYVVFFIVAAIFIVLAAFQYLTAGGDEEKVGKAKNMLIYAIVAIAVALIATGVSSIVRGFLSNPGSVG